jgi:phage shock protein C
MNGPLLRPRSDRRIAGVCAAFARAYGWDLTLVRLATVVLACCVGGGFLAYIICWIVIPEDPIALPPYPPNYPPTVPPAA